MYIHSIISYYYINMNTEKVFFLCLKTCFFNTLNLSTLYKEVTPTGQWYIYKYMYIYHILYIYIYINHVNISIENMKLAYMCVNFIWFRYILICSTIVLSTLFALLILTFDFGHYWLFFLLYIWILHTDILYILII